ncbi:cytochrome P450 3A8-like [Oppia nitens]|uniref:cytochrome P450 3A8-like n=1 Tax=Oppia nitens TaxID=1686743 RepID=UPI0023DB9608|nr:cytochrome P450 3A8-like [Oppia nitens]
MIYTTRNFNYWSSRGIPGPKPLPLLGNLFTNLLKPIPKVLLDNHKLYGKVYGTYMGSLPILNISDPQLVKQMNIRDFNVFIDRNDIDFVDPLQERSLFNMKANEWKNMRSIISPTFSSSKMRSMHPIVVDCVQRLDRYMEPKARNRETIETKKTMGCLTMDVIAACAFGTQIDTYDDQKPSEFVLNAQKVFAVGLRPLLFLAILSMGKRFLKLTGYKFTDPTVEKFFTQAIQSIIAKRKSSDVKQQQQQQQKPVDYLQLILDAKDKCMDTNDEELDVNGSSSTRSSSSSSNGVDDSSKEIYGQSDDTNDKTSNTNNNNKLIDITDTDVLASSYVFFVAGYETTGSLLSLLFYRLALDEDCQQKLFDEIRRLNGRYDYETIGKMSYLEACIAETLRLYNPAAYFTRIANQDYTIESIGLKIPKGMNVSFDIETLHHNPDYYPEPDCWKPDRFMPENRDRLVPYTYMPFGLGPRNCVAMRFALMETKTAVVYLVNKYHFYRTPETNLQPKPQIMQFLLNLKPLNIGIELRN